MNKTLHSTRVHIFTRKYKRLASACIFLLFFAMPGSAQVREIVVPSSQFRLLRTIKIATREVEAPANVDPNAIYSNVTNFAGTATNNGGAAVINGNTITTLLADSLGLVGTPSFSIGGFTFSVANFNGVAVSARPLIRFYSGHGTGGSPGTILAAFDFAPISFSPGVVSLFTGNVTPFTAPTNALWAGIFFDNDTATTGATLAQLNNLGVGVYDTVDVGSSTDGFFASDLPDSFLTDNPVGSDFTFGGPPLANFAWEIISAIPLPVTLNGFTAHRNGLINTLTWNTAQELNSNYFSVEHSVDGIHFSKIGEVKAGGNSNVARSYHFDDASPTRGINYYRLRLVDIDNSGKYSSIVTVKNTGSLNFTLYPNPVKTTMLLNLDAEKTETAEVNITDMNGRMVYERQITVTRGNNNFPINVSQFSKGTYSIKVRLSSGSYTSKFSKL